MILQNKLPFEFACNSDKEQITEFVDKIKRGDSNNNGSVDDPDKIISFKSE